MSKDQKIVFSFDNQPYERLDTKLADGQELEMKRLDNEDDPDLKVEITNPTTGKTRLLILPKSAERKFSCFP